MQKTYLSDAAKITLTNMSEGETGLKLAKQMRWVASTVIICLSAFKKGMSSMNPLNLLNS